MSTARFASVVTIVAALLFVAGASPAHAGRSKALKCAFAKQLAALDEADALLACARQAARANAAIDPACTAAAIAARDDAFDDAEENGGCKPEGDADVIEQIVARFAKQLGQELQGTCGAAGSSCGMDDPPCCTGLVCSARI